MNNFESQRQESLKRSWQERRAAVAAATATSPKAGHVGGATPSDLLRRFPCGFDDDLVSTLVPPVTVVLDGRSICHRISLHKHASYKSLAKALRQMFVVVDGDISDVDHDNLDLSNAVPGHLIAYEDMENDLLLVGDLNWKDFVRVAKRIRIMPLKPNSRKRRVGA